MAQSVAPVVGEKRGPGRPAKNAQPVDKRRKLSTTLYHHVSSSAQSPVGSSPAPERRWKGLPPRIVDSRPLPTLSEAQPLTLSKDEYQTIAASAVLQSSLDRSRSRWINDGVLERYWVKPESGKNARPVPSGNPEVKWQKHKGPCRIRVEPHIFEAEMYVEEKPKSQPTQVKQYIPPAHHQQAYGQPYRQSQQAYQQQYYQNRALPPMQHPHHGAVPPNHLPPGNSVSQPSTPGQQSPAPSQQEKKASPDPVISLLATRASSDPELKALMKDVATGTATQDQLKIFQGHIDELTSAVNEREKKEKDEEVAKAASVEANRSNTQQNDMIQYDGAGDAQAQHPPYRPPAPNYQQPQQQAYSPAPSVPTSQSVILAFTNPGATEDRFLFPQHSIIEALSPQHLLASFVITRKGREAIDATGLDPEAEYWQPVTLMVEVAYNREHLLDCVRRWVKPAEEAKKYMEDVMARCNRVPETYLALRLPFKGTSVPESEDVVSEDSRGTPLRIVEEKVKPKSSIKYVKKSLSSVKGEPGAKTKDDGVKNATTTAVSAADTRPPVDKDSKEPVAGPAADVAPGSTEDATGITESGRPKRSTRKSVRISEG